MAPGGTRWRWLDLAGWAIVAVAGFVMLTQAVGWAGTRSIAAVQSLTPYLALGLVPIISVALWRRRHRMATVGAAIGAGALVLAAPLAFPDPTPRAADAIGLRVASANLYFGNERISEVADALLAEAPDVVVMSEYTGAHRRALEQHPLADNYRYRIGGTGLSPGGTAVWSTLPIAVGDDLDTVNDAVDLIVDGPDEPVRVVAMHMPTPLLSFDGWRRDLRTAATIARTTTVPTLIIGDLNATWWHPDFRQLLDAGLTDAHASNGVGLSTSWPTDRAFPPFVRLDHALTTDDLVATDVVDVDIPGSDHTGFVVTVAPAARAAP